MKDGYRDLAGGIVGGAGIGAGVGIKDYLKTKAIFDGINSGVGDTFSELNRKKGLKGWVLRKLFGKVPKRPLGKFPKIPIRNASIATGTAVALPSAAALALALRISRGRRNNGQK